MSSKRLVVMLNPKTSALVEVYGQPRGDGNAGFRMAIMGSEECISDCWTEGDEVEQIGRGRYVRIHSAGHCSPGERATFELSGVSPRYYGEGYGFMTYAAAAIGIHELYPKYAGVHSPRGGPNANRNPWADRLWKSMEENELSDVAEIEGGEEEDTTEHCERVRNDTYEDGDGKDWTIMDDEVCATVTITREDEDYEVDYLNHERVKGQPFVLWVNGNASRDVPPDLVVRAQVKTADVAAGLARYIQHTFPDELPAFLAREDVSELLRGSFRTGTSAVYEVRGATRKPSLPPLSATSRRLIRMFENMP